MGLKSVLHRREDLTTVVGKKKERLTSLCAAARTTAASDVFHASVQRYDISANASRLRRSSMELGRPAESEQPAKKFDAVPPLTVSTLDLLGGETKSLSLPSAFCTVEPAKGSIEEMFARITVSKSLAPQASKELTWCDLLTTTESAPMAASTLNLLESEINGKPVSLAFSSEVVAEGSFAKIVAGLDVNDPSQHYALKITDHKSFHPADAAKEAALGALSQSKTAPIATFSQEGRIVSVMHPMGDNLATALKKLHQQPKSGAFRAAVTLKALMQPAEQLANLHESGKIHADIKPANLMIDCTDSKEAKVHLSDFGTSIDATEPGSSDSSDGTPEYMAPEMHILGDGQPTLATDVYALGLTGLEITTGSRLHASVIDADRDRFSNMVQMSTDYFPALQRFYSSEPSSLDAEGQQFAAVFSQIENAELRGLLHQAMDFNAEARPTAKQFEQTLRSAWNKVPTPQKDAATEFLLQQNSTEKLMQSQWQKLERAISDGKEAAESFK
jgi:hypothetical protein